jgi:hypothetical protein
LEQLRDWKDFKEEDSKARGLIQLNLSEGLRMEVDGCLSAKAVWKKLNVTGGLVVTGVLSIVRRVVWCRAIT